MWCLQWRQRISSDGSLDVELGHCTLDIMMMVPEVKKLVI